jgi:hypothetical protein
MKFYGTPNHNEDMTFPAFTSKFLTSAEVRGWERYEEKM